MALTRLSAPVPFLSYGPQLTLGNATMNAAGESVSSIGILRLKGGSGTKTLSAAGGGEIWFSANSAATFANAGTSLDFGVQDLDLATGLEDGTYDVLATYIGGTDTIPGAAAWFKVAMDSGTKDMTHGSPYCIVATMTARGGADTVVLSRRAIPTIPSGSTAALPYGSLDTGTLAKDSLGVMCLIKFDDGTFGWIDGMIPLLMPDGAATSVLFASDSALDEYSATIQVPIKMTIGSVEFGLSAIATGDTGEFHIYGDPGGTPTDLITPIDIDPDAVSSGTTGLYKVTFPELELAANTSYAFAYLATSTGTRRWAYHDLGSAFEDLKTTQPFSSILAQARANETGAFSTVQTYHVPVVGLWATHLDDGASAGGGGLRLAGHGGLAS